MALRGMLVVLIIVFHCSFYYGFTFPDLGHIAVSMFLFFSGYGLELSLHRKKGYLKGFPSNRIFGILVQYWTIVLAIAVIELLMYPDPIRWTVSNRPCSKHPTGSWSRSWRSKSCST